jgi:predicted ribosomally synthesized peptide with nif11-like leader
VSREAAIAFYERLEKEPALAERLRELETPAQVENYVKGELGYDFTKAEIQKVIFEKNPGISDEELEAVVGGLDGNSIAIGVAIGGGMGLIALAALAAAA